MFSISKMFKEPKITLVLSKGYGEMTPPPPFFFSVLPTYSPPVLGEPGILRERIFLSCFGFWSLVPFVFSRGWELRKQTVHLESMVPVGILAPTEPLGRNSALHHLSSLILPPFPVPASLLMLYLRHTFIPWGIASFSLENSLLSFGISGNKGLYLWIINLWPDCMLKLSFLWGQLVNLSSYYWSLKTFFLLRSLPSLVSFQIIICIIHLSFLLYVSPLLEDQPPPHPSLFVSSPSAHSCGLTVLWLFVSR